MTMQFHRNTQPSDGHQKVRHVLYARAIDELYSPFPAPTVYPRGEKERLYDLARQIIGNEPITYLEFGVNRGTSLRKMLQIFTHQDARFFGFDSFEGLPELWVAGMDKGHFATSGHTPDISDDRVTLVKGWFQNTVEKFLSENKTKAPVLVHFDADLYSSTLFLLTTLFHSISDYYFVFDEYSPDEICAMYDFTRAYPVEFQYLASTCDEVGKPLQIFGRLRGVTFNP
jgi:O-methyltransferase